MERVGLKLGEVFAKGADVSWIPAMEDQGYVWYGKDGKQKDYLKILKEDYGMNAVRLRVFYQPSMDHGCGWCDTIHTVAMAKRVLEMGMQLMIDFHYSDSWADPEKQSKPDAWKEYSFSKLKQAVYDHTYDVMAALAKENIFPQWVQIGNETNDGMLWEEGRASKSFQNFAELINQGYEAVKSVSSESMVIVHVSNGYDGNLFRWMFDGIVAAGAKFDVIGMSLYPEPANWRTFTADAYETMRSCINLYGKKIMVCEVGMNYKNPVECADYIRDLIIKTRSLINGLGVFYWEPESIPGYNDSYQLGATKEDGSPTGALDGFIEE